MLGPHSCCHLIYDFRILQVFVDRGFKNDMQELPIVCALCDWSDILRNYEV